MNPEATSPLSSATYRFLPVLVSMFISSILVIGWIQTTLTRPEIDLKSEQALRVNIANLDRTLGDLRAATLMNASQHEQLFLLEEANFRKKTLHLLARKFLMPAPQLTSLSHSLVFESDKKLDLIRATTQQQNQLRRYEHSLFQ